MVFATDLDNTMIFSHRLIGGLEKSVRCVEFYQGKPITYMTYTAIEKLKMLVSKMHVIPVTTRSVSQLNRVEFWSTTEYAIADNGGTILHHGVPLIEWEQHIQEVLSSYDLQAVYKIFSELPSLHSAPRIVDNKFVYAKSDNVEACKQLLLQKLNTKIWQISIQGSKIYAIPQGITKGVALKHLCENILCHYQPVITAGDSTLDISMLEYATYGIIPSDCSLATLEENNWLRANSGIYSSDAILDYVASFC